MSHLGFDATLVKADDRRAIHTDDYTEKRHTRRRACRTGFSVDDEDALGSVGKHKPDSAQRKAVRVSGKS